MLSTLSRTDSIMDDTDLWCHSIIPLNTFTIVSLTSPIMAIYNMSQVAVDEYKYLKK